MSNSNSRILKDSFFILFFFLFCSLSDAPETANLVLRRASAPFSYELCASVVDASGLNNQIPPFTLSEALNFTRLQNSHTKESFYWQDQAEEGIVWEFQLSDKETSASTVEMFQMTVAQCIYEAEKQKPHVTASDEDLKPFIQTLQAESSSKDKPKKSAEDDEGKRKVLFKSELAGFYAFDATTGLFAPKCEAVYAKLTSEEDSSFKFWLSVVDAKDNNILHRQVIDVDATQHLDRITFSFIWCHFSESGYIWTFSLRFKSVVDVLAFANGYNQCVYEALNKEKWSKLEDKDARYLLNPMLDVEMTSAADDEDGERDESEDESSDDEHRSQSSPIKTKFSSGKNQLLSVGYRTDRSFVARGSSIGIFKPSDDDNSLSLLTSSQMAAPDGTEFEASKMMLHREDRNLLLMSRDKPQSVFCMDLERGKVVEEWQIHDSAPITSMIPDSKYSQMTDQSTFIGLNANSLFRVDPRLPGNKRVDTEMKSYAVKNDFSCGATTGAGELAVASARGEIRLFNKLDKRAKTLLPMFGDPILGIDVTESGKYILATCKTYLLLICTEIPGSGGELGFTKSMGADKAVPRRLQLKPEHVAYMGTQPSFTPARFSTGQSEEKSIITSTGPFVITWNLRRVKQGHLYDYQIKRYEDTVVADNFRYNQDRSIVVTLPEHVTMISKKSLSSPSPKLLSKSDIVEEKW